MRVIHFLPSLNRRAGGVASFVISVADACANSNVEVAVATNDSIGIPEYWGSDQSRCRQIKVSENASQRALQDTVCRADIVHLHGPWERQNARFAHACHQRGVPYVISLHGMINSWTMNNGWRKAIKKRLYLAAIARKMIYRAASVHCTARFEAESAKIFLPRASFAVLPCAVETSSLSTIHRKTTPETSDEIKVLFLGRLHPIKRPELLIQASRLLPNARINFAGPGDPTFVSGLQKMASSLGVEHRINFAGMVNGEDRINAFREADCFALPSDHENFGMVLAEAMVAGLPTITTKGAAIWREIESAGAWIVDQTPESLATAIQTIASDRPGAAVRGLRGRAFVLEQFSAERLGPAYRDLYLSAKERQAT